jgi:hypothetical protein
VLDQLFRFEREHADREKIATELSELQKNSALAAIFWEKLEPDVATIFSQLRTRRKKSSMSLANIEAILEIIEES